MGVDGRRRVIVRTETLRERSIAVLALAPLLAIPPWPNAAQAQEPPGAPCPEEAAADSLTDAAWDRFRAGEIEAAGSAFRASLERCPEHRGARVGLGYVALRQGRLERARSRFRGVSAEFPSDVDAHLGLGLVAWRSDRHVDAAEHMLAVLGEDPDNATAREILERIPEAEGPPPERPALVRPDSLVLWSRARGDRFEIRAGDGWQPFYVKGVNLGAALPGRYPSQFPDDSVYTRWVRDIADSGFNALRLYTIHPPGLYEAVREHNLDRPDRPLWLIHGVWAELPPGSDYSDPDWRGEYVSEMRRVVDVVHGRADVAPRPGHAAGHYTADVSRWTLAYLIGREWEPYSVLSFNRSEGGGESDWSGTYLAVTGGSPMEVWLGRILEEIVGYEMRRYHAQRPVAYTSWPTLDPMTHVTEATEREAWRIRRSIGMSVGALPPEIGFDDDAVALDARRMASSGAFVAGIYAAFHVYPYYPDFMVLDPEYRRARSPWGRSTYFGYLEDLKAHHPELPVLVAEYGVPSSVGIAQLQPQGWHHGGHTESRMAEIDARMTREIAAAEMAGGVVFAWIDEWFKANWLVDQFELPAERDRFWLNRMDPEENYGLLALEPPPPDSVPADGGGDGWTALTGTGGRAGEAEAAVDAAQLWLRWRLPEDVEPYRARIRIGFVAEAFGRDGPDFAFRLVASRDTVRVEAREGMDPFRVLALEPPTASAPRSVPCLASAPAGYFHGWSAVGLGPPTSAVEEPAWTGMPIVVNRTRIGRDTTAFPALGYDRGYLPGGSWPDGSWSWSEDGRTLRVAVPWALLNVTDPGRRQFLRPVETAIDRRQLDDPVARRSVPSETATADAIALSFMAVGGSGSWSPWPGPGPASDAHVELDWEDREEPRWRSRPKAALRAMRETFDDLRPTVLETEGRTP